MKYLGAIMFALLAGVAAAHADYRSEYKQYAEAFNAGDTEGAVAHAEAAWRAAEEELGDHPTTAILALNFANIISPYAPGRALEAYERALAITRMGMGSLDIFELELRTAETRLTLDIKNHQLGDALGQLLETGEQKSDAPALAMALGWKTFAIHLSQRDKISKAKDAGDLAIKYASALDPREPRLLAEALVLGATLRLATPYRTEEDIIEMVTYLDSSFELFAPQPSIDAFDPLLARAIQLRATAGALASSSDFKPFIGRGTDTHLPTGENLAEAFERAEARSDVEQQVTWAEARSPFCSQTYVWEERKPPSYPRRAIQRIYTGAVLIGYDMSETGVARTVILADADEAGFGDAAEKAMQKWKLAQTVPPQCRRNHLAIFTFTIKQF